MRRHHKGAVVFLLLLSRCPASTGTRRPPPSCWCCTRSEFLCRALYRETIVQGDHRPGRPFFQGDTLYPGRPFLQRDIPSREVLSPETLCFPSVRRHSSLRPSDQGKGPRCPAHASAGSASSLSRAASASACAPCALPSHPSEAAVSVSPLTEPRRPARPVYVDTGPHADRNRSCGKACPVAQLAGLVQTLEHRNLQNLPLSRRPASTGPPPLSAHETLSAHKNEPQPANQNAPQGQVAR